jgi:hypothetical protein
MARKDIVRENYYMENIYLRTITMLMCLILTAKVIAQDATILEVLPPKNLFDAPIADPRWPKFTMGLSHDFEGGFGHTLWNFSFGEDIGLLKFGSKKYPFEFGIQAGAFGVMDIDTTPSRLINTDYFIALEISHVHNSFQHLLQVYHQSSHVGDELLLSADGQNINRINLSYEVVKYFLRYKPSQNFSPYATAGYLFHVDPNYIKRWVFSAGLDLYSNKIIFKDSTRLIAGAFINSWQENNYSPTVTVRAGLQYERVKYCNRFLQLLLQYQGGRSHHGQFYRTTVNEVSVLVAFSS